MADDRQEHSVALLAEPGMREPRRLDRNRFISAADPHSGETLYSVAMGIDDLVEARRQADALVSQIRPLQDLSGVGHWTFDVKLGDVFCSSHCQTILGLTTEAAFEGLTFDALIGCCHPDDQIAFRAALEEALTDGKAFHLTHRIRRQSGEDREGLVTQIVTIAQANL